MVKTLLYIIVILVIYIKAHAGVVTSVSVKELGGVTTQNYPITFAIGFKKGDVPSGVLVKHDGVALTTQFDVKRTWSDGSAKHGVISVVIPSVDANSSESLTIETASTNSGTGALDKTAILATDVESLIELANLSGSNNPSSGSASLRTQINSGNLSYWLQGPVCTEILEDISITPNDNLHARWEARFYPGTSFGIRISNIVESVNIAATGNSQYDVSIDYGYASPTEKYTKSGFKHPYGSRWRKTFWLGSEPPKTVVAYDTAYLIASGLVPSLDLTLPKNTTEINSQYNLLTGSRSALPGESGTVIYGYRGGDDIDGAGNIMRAGPTPGGRPDLGIIPTWNAFHLLYYDDKTDWLMKGNGDVAGHMAQLHFRESDPTKTNGYGKPIVSIVDRPDISFLFYQDGGSYGNLPAPIAGGNAPNNPNAWNPDRAHQGDYIYIPYLLTGEHYYMEELCYFASWTAAYSAWGRNGNNSKQNFSAQFPAGSASGIVHDETRAVAWALRMFNNAATILPDSMSGVSSYFRDMVSNNMHWLYLGNTDITGHGLGFIRVPREENWTPGSSTHTLYQAPWMHDFNVLVLTDILRKQEGASDLAKVSSLRDRFGAFTVGRFNNHPNFNKYDGAGFYWALTKTPPDNANYYTGATWAEYYQDLLTDDPLQGSGYTQNMPHSSYSHYTGDSESYLYLAKSTLAGLTHLTGGQDAYNFVASEAVDAQEAESPNWGGLVPSQLQAQGTRYRIRIQE